MAPGTSATGVPGPSSCALCHRRDLAAFSVSTSFCVATNLVSQSLNSEFPKDCYDGLNLNYELVSLGYVYLWPRKLCPCSKDSCFVRSPPPGQRVEQMNPEGERHV